MLKIACPKCQHPSTIAQPKAGKFSPTCSRCKTKFKLLVKSQSDGTFTSKTSLASVEEPPQTSSNQSTAVQPPLERLGRVVRNEGQDTAQPELLPPDGETAEAKSKLSIGSNLGPYRLLKFLGQGGMGEVYLAKQTSLDRDVALKVINIQLSESPRALARFTREAYAAAQLVHPNIVQVYDMGDDRGFCYFSMEFVAGHTLAEVVAKEERLEPEQAASFILQAARGLAHAHAAGMVHRDVKPGNLLVDHSGVVKVADLGLVKVPDLDEIEEANEVADMSALSASQDLTRYGSAVGTPYYMAPEQAKNAVDVDHRADIYALGCTFYVLLTGKRPFEGKTFEEIVKQHYSAPVIEPSRLVDRVPASLSSIVKKMMEKNPKDRYQSLDVLIPELEQFLGIAAANCITEEDVKTIERNVIKFNGVKRIALRRLVPYAMVFGCGFLAFMMSFLSWRWAGSFLAMPILAIFAFFLVSGSRENSPLFAKARELVFESGVLSWLKWLLTGLILVAASFLIGLYFPLMIAAIAGTALAIAYYVLVEREIIAERKVPLEETEKLLRKMRLKGMDESSVQTIVARNSGRHWEEFFEHLFDYESKRRMRDEFAKSANAQSRSRFWAWRDKIYDAWNSRLRILKATKERKHIERVEFAGLKAEGFAATDARDRAGQMAGAVVDQAAEQKIAALEKRVAELDPDFRQEMKRDRIKQLLADARSGKYRQKKTRLQQLEPTLNRYAGSYARFLLGCLLIVGGLLWARQNGILAAVRSPASIIRQATDETEGLNQDSEASVAPDATNTDKTKWVALKDALNKETAPLKFPIVGKLLFTDCNSLIAGLILVVSAIVFGWKMTLFAIPAAIIAIFGSYFITFDVETVPIIHSFSALIAVGVFLMGIVFGRAED